MPGSSDKPTPSAQAHTSLLATDSKNSIVAELAAGRNNAIVYAAYGHQAATQKPAKHLGFNGELREMGSGWYLLGNGYRAYNPILMRFHSPDSWSPFGEGGLNAYMYCDGEPVMGADPSGHFRVINKLMNLTLNAITARPVPRRILPKLTGKVVHVSDQASALYGLASTTPKPPTIQRPFYNPKDWTATPSENQIDNIVRQWPELARRHNVSAPQPSLPQETDEIVQQMNSAHEELIASLRDLIRSL